MLEFFEMEVVTAEELWDFVLETIGVSLHELVMTLCLLLVLIFQIGKTTEPSTNVVGKISYPRGTLVINLQSFFSFACTSQSVTK